MGLLTLHSTVKLSNAMATPAFGITDLRGWDQGNETQQTYRCLMITANCARINLYILTLMEYQIIGKLIIRDLATLKN